ncbi:hypothetical protein SLNSH_04250 [Alsobacter soli]|uniref:Thioester reductase (TE) domain-containing protein n=1 Tax=Alsobacter soli TaxID=2109933 RepID=A0A2T1HY05_9HYPH|nr:SDR family oxidoreductase [Alsobacter soli]PSC06495.1 hypothetical protein SLNSH_04250 [Alsobacter soli]
MGTLLTGATGTLGSQLLPRLVDAGEPVIGLVRADDEAHARRRLQPLLPSGAEVGAVRGDIGAPLCGLSASKRASLAGRVSRILHCAASIDFLDAEQAMASNVGGVRNMLDLADALGVREVLHVSTAYVAGDARRFGETDYAVGQRWRNPYETSKHTGEGLVRAWAASAAGRRFAIYRPAILVGGQDGYTPGFDAFYTYCKALAVAAAVLRRRAGARLPDSVAVSSEGVVHMPVAVRHDVGATLNLVPLDWAADAIVALLRVRAEGVFHLTHPHPPQVDELWADAQRALRITGLRVCRTDAEKAAALSAMPPVMARLQKGLEPVFQAYQPYTTGEPVFGVERLRAALGDAYRDPPAVDGAYVVRLLAFAEQAGWGDRAPGREAIAAA